MADLVLGERFVGGWQLREEMKAILTVFVLENKTQKATTSFLTYVKNCRWELCRYVWIILKWMCNSVQIIFAKCTAKYYDQ